MPDYSAGLLPRACSSRFIFSSLVLGFGPEFRVQGARVPR